ncbi:MAG: Asp-tRNA(Asn)/Glu-tRNA(Gln) amidotransferase subunit GatC [Desulfobacteraceae bacterium]|nr:MAG: Asp-tRNA(Asn)/Glu-tRNA(Gln) amidotransferase subunit GatC [Desulfobacteraceae bacterium]
MKINAAQVKHVAELARLVIEPGSVDRLCQQVATILAYVDALNEVDTRDVPPTSHAIALTNAFRDDVEHPHLGAEQALANAPSRGNGCFVVPKIIQQD